MESIKVEYKDNQLVFELNGTQIKIDTAEDRENPMSTNDTKMKLNFLWVIKGYVLEELKQFYDNFADEIFKTHENKDVRTEAFYLYKEEVPHFDEYIKIIRDIKKKFNIAPNELLQKCPPEKLDEAKSILEGLNIIKNKMREAISKTKPELENYNFDFEGVTQYRADNFYSLVELYYEIKRIEYIISETESLLHSVRKEITLYFQEFNMPFD
jgi:hypothetical protein